MQPILAYALDERGSWAPPNPLHRSTESTLLTAECWEDHRHRDAGFVHTPRIYRGRDPCKWKRRQSLGQPGTSNDQHGRLGMSMSTLIREYTVVSRTWPEELKKKK